MSAGVFVLGLICTSVANAASVTYILDNANWKSLLPDGENYATVMIDDTGGNINFNVEINPLIFIENPDASYGINTFSFNNPCGISLTDCGPKNNDDACDGIESSFLFADPLMDSWHATVDTKTKASFGDFDVEISGRFVS